MSQQATLSLSTKDVIHIEGFQENASLFKNESTLRIRTILQQLQSACTASGMGLAEVNALMEQGIPCEVLQPGAADWQMGSIRLSLEFQPGRSSAASMDSTVMANTVTIQSNAVATPVMATAVSAAVAAPAIVAPMDLGNEIEAEGSLDSGLSDDLDDTFDVDMDNLSGDGFSEDVLSGDDLDMGGLDMGGLDMADLGDDSLKGDAPSGMMPDAVLEESLNSDLDLSGLSDMDGLDDGLDSDDLSFDLDSQAVDADDLGGLDGLGDLNSPWDMSDDLDEMMLK